MRMLFCLNIIALCFLSFVTINAEEARPTVSDVFDRVTKYVPSDYELDAVVSNDEESFIASFDEEIEYLELVDSEQIIVSSVLTEGNVFIIVAKKDRIKGFIKEMSFDEDVLAKMSELEGLKRFPSNCVAYAFIGKKSALNKDQVVEILSRD